MDFTKFFETQRQLDERIYERFPELKEQNNLDWKILALQVEIGECANEWRGFKKWSKKQSPRLHQYLIRNDCDNWVEVDDHPWKINHGDDDYEYKGNCWDERFPLLEEYVDGLAFILSIGLEFEFDDRPTSLAFLVECERDNLVLMFQEVISYASDLFWDIHQGDDHETQEFLYKSLLSNFIKLGEMLGFTWEQIEQAYYDKNKINLERQANGY